MCFWGLSDSICQFAIYITKFTSFFINTSRNYRRVLFVAYLIPNLLAYTINFIDFAYYRFAFTRASIASLESYKSSDKSLSTNLKAKKEKEMKEMNQMANGFEQDYMNRMLNRRLSADRMQ
jgi:hypothetical protein